MKFSLFIVLVLCTAMIAGCGSNAPKSVVEDADQEKIREYKEALARVTSEKIVEEKEAPSTAE